MLKDGMLRRSGGCWHASAPIGHPTWSTGAFVGMLLLLGCPTWSTGASGCRPLLLGCPTWCIWVQACQLRPCDGHHLSRGVQLHGARAQWDHAVCQGQVLVLQALQVPAVRVCMCVRARELAGMNSFPGSIAVLP
eukprot:1151812-Pelagomonas_calceolata.AAC.1